MQRLEKLLHFTSELAAAITLDDVFDVIAEECSEILGTVGLRVAAIDASGLTATFRSGRGIGGDVGLSMPLTSRSIGCEAMRSDRIVMVPNRAELLARYPDSPILTDSDFGRVMSLPIHRSDEVVGAWVLAFAENGNMSPPDIAVARLLAEQAGHATWRAARRAELDAARELDQRRRKMTEALNHSMTMSDLADALVESGQEAMGAGAIALFVPDAIDQHHLRLVGGVGFDASDKLAMTMRDPVVASCFVRREPIVVLSSPDTPPPVVGETPFDWTYHALIPLVLANEPLGMVLMGLDNNEATTAGFHVALAGLGAELSVALSRAHRFDLEQNVARTLQQNLRPALPPEVDGWKFTTSYAAGTVELLVGGDLFEITPVADNQVFVAVGDIVGHGLEAAATMGELKSATRALHLVSQTPTAVIDGLRAFADITPGVFGSTICCVHLGAGGRAVVTSAGHIFPVLVRSDGECSLIEEGRSPLLGIAGSAKDTAVVDLGVGDSLVLYTDGLVERRGESIDDGIERLQRSLQDGSCGRPPDAHLILTAMHAGEVGEDDTVVVTITRE